VFLEDLVGDFSDKCGAGTYLSALAYWFITRFCHDCKT